MAKQKITKQDIARFTLTITEANSMKIEPDDLKGLTEIIPNKKYRILISIGFKRDGSRDRYSETYEGTLLNAIKRKNELKSSFEEKNISADSKSTFDLFSKKYLSYLEEKVQTEQINLTTYENYYNLLNKRILPHFKDMVISEINERDIENWLYKLSKTKTQRVNRAGEYLHPTTIAHSFKLLINMFNYAKLDRILKENPCDYVKKRPTESPDEKEYFTLEEMDYVKGLLANANIRLRTAIFLIMDTGCRREEVIGLKWKDIDFDNKTIDINKAVVSTTSNAPLTKKRVREKCVKTKHSLRKIGVPQVSMDMLKQYKYFKKDSGLKVRDDDYVFTNWDSNQVLDPNRLTTDWYNFRRDNNIKKQVTVHGLRHSNATFLLSTGAIDKDVAKRLGHTTEVLSRIYTHSNIEDDKKLVESLEENFYKFKQKEFNIYSIISVITGVVNNEYKDENYRLLDYLTNDNVTSDNIDSYLIICKNYLLNLFPKLEMFTDTSLLENEELLKMKASVCEELLGEKLKIENSISGLNKIGI